MKRLSEFYDLMHATIPIRRDLVDFKLINVDKPSRVAALQKSYKRLEETPRDEQGRLLLEDERGRQVHIKADYEQQELEKDLFFFKEGETAFGGYLSQLHPRFSEEVKELVDLLGSAAFELFFTDRDGTVNNYCGRYRSSVQSAYNALFLTRFGRTVRQKPVILTSAPLKETGIVDLTVIPEEIYLLAGSKGREYSDIHGEVRTYPIGRSDAERMKELNRRISALLEEPENRIFFEIGSSFQPKFGETTVARQDVYGSVPQEESERFKREVEAIVEELNGDESRLRIEDTGKDLEIILASQEAEAHFDKGDGLEFLVDELGLDLEKKEMLICGDTSSDIPMVGKATELGAQVTALFVTTDEGLRREVRDSSHRSHFVSNPDVLVTGLDLASKENGV